MLSPAQSFIVPQGGLSSEHERRAGPEGTWYTLPLLAQTQNASIKYSLLWVKGSSPGSSFKIQILLWQGISQGGCESNVQELSGWTSCLATRGEGLPPTAHCPDLSCLPVTSALWPWEARALERRGSEIHSKEASAVQKPWCPFMSQAHWLGAEDTWNCLPMQSKPGQLHSKLGRTSLPQEPGMQAEPPTRPPLKPALLFHACFPLIGKQRTVRMWVPPNKKPLINV